MNPAQPVTGQNDNIRRIAPPVSAKNVPYIAREGSRLRPEITNPTVSATTSVLASASADLAISPNETPPTIRLIATTGATAINVCNAQNTRAPNFHSNNSGPRTYESK